VGKGAVDSQHGTGVEESSTPYAKGCHPTSTVVRAKGLLIFCFNRNTYVDFFIIYAVNRFLVLLIYFSSAV
jgi:hypothetical protein